MNCTGLAVHDGTVATNEVWRADKVHVVSQQVYIPAGRRLTIADGATVRFCENTGFRVDGTLVCGNGLHFIMGTIGDNAFKDITGLVSVVFMDGLTSIGSNAFDGCTGLTTVTLPCTLASIGTNAFACANLKLMVMECEAPPIVSGNL